MKLCFLRSQEHEPDELSSKKTKDQLYLRKEIQKHLNYFTSESDSTGPNTYDNSWTLLVASGLNETSAC